MSGKRSIDDITSGKDNNKDMPMAKTKGKRTSKAPKRFQDQPTDGKLYHYFSSMSSMIIKAAKIILCIFYY